MSEKRKEDHVRICLSGDVEGPGSTGFQARVTLSETSHPPPADEVDPGAGLLGYRLNLPIMISAMSGGWGLGRLLNETLASLASRWRIGLSVGSMRPALIDPMRAGDYDIKALAPDVPVFGNLGVWQLRDVSLAARYRNLCLSLGFDGVTVHVNPAHEEAQPEGERDLTGMVEALDRFSGAASLPVFVKEVGHGFTSEILEQLSRLPIQGLDIAGAGGTNWPLVEATRIPVDDPAHSRAMELSTQGRDTLSTLLDAAPLFREKTLVAGGGIRSCADIVKAVGLGADLVSMAAPILRLVCSIGDDGEIHVDGSPADAWLHELSGDLPGRIAGTGARSLEELRYDGRVVVRAS